MVDPEEASEAAARWELERELDGDLPPADRDRSPHDRERDRSPRGQQQAAAAPQQGGQQGGQGGQGQGQGQAERQGGSPPLLSTLAFREGRLGDRVSVRPLFLLPSASPLFFSQLPAAFAVPPQSIAHNFIFICRH